MDTTQDPDTDQQPLTEELQALLRPLTGKQQKFVLAYVGEARFNQTKAAEIAGYASPNNQVWRLMTDPDISAAIEGFLAPQIMGASEILSRLDEQARLDVSEFFDFADGYDKDMVPYAKVVFNATKAMASGKMHLIKGFEYSKSGDLQVIFHDAQAAQVLLGKHRKLFTDRIEHSGSIDYSTLPDDELAAIAAGKSAR
jgi:hypothetical protein